MESRRAARPGSRCGSSVRAPHQPRRAGRGDMARPAASRPAASAAAAAQERSPRPPSGCGGQSPGDCARPGAHLSRLALAAPLSNIRLWGFSPAAPFREPERINPFGRALRESLKASRERRGWGVGWGAARERPAD